MSHLKCLNKIRRADGVWDDPSIFVLSVKDSNSKSGGVHLADVLIERREEYVESPHTRELLNATIEFQYQRLVPRGDSHETIMTSFRASFNARDNSVSLVNGGIFLDLDGLRGQRIGTYLMSSVVRWAKQWPTATVARIQLMDTGSTELRNHFYERYGLKFSFDDAEMIRGSSLPMLVRDLTEVDTWKANIQMLPLDTYVGILLRARQDSLTELECRSRALRERVEEDQTRQARPFRWAFGQLVGSSGTSF